MGWEVMKEVRKGCKRRGILDGGGMVLFVEYPEIEKLEILWPQDYRILYAFVCVPVF